MEKRYKGRERNISFMMKGKTLAVIGALAALGVATYAQSTTPTIGQLAQAMKTNPTAWTVVVGANAKASDVVGASNIIAALETFTSVPTSSSVNTSSLQVTLQAPVQVVSGAYNFYTSQAPLRLGYTLNQVVSAFQVASGSFTIGNTQYTYTAYVFPTSNYQLGYIPTSTSTSNPSPAVALYSSTQSTAFNLSIYITPSVNITQLTTSPVPITILGKTYYLTYNSQNNELGLVPAAEVTTLQIGQNVTYNGVTIELVDVVAQLSGSTETYAVILNINGQEYTVQTGSQISVDGVNILVTSAYVSEIYKGVGYAQLVISTEGFYIPVQSGAVTVYNANNQPINNVQAVLSFPTSDELSSITFEYTLPQIDSTSDYGVVSGTSYTLPVFDAYQLTVGSVAFPLPGSTQISVVASSSSNTTTITFTDAATGQQYSLPIYYNSSGYNGVSPAFIPFSSNPQYWLGTITPNPSASSTTSVTLVQGAYFVVYNPQLQQSQIYYVQSINTNEGYVVFQNVITGQTVQVYSGQPLIALGGFALTVSVSSSGATLSGYLTQSTTTLNLGAQNNVLITVNNLDENASTVSPTLTITKSYPGTSLSTSISATLSVGAISSLTGLSYPVQASTSSGTTTYYVDQAGTYAVYVVPTSGSQTLTVYVPQSPLAVDVSLEPVSATSQYETITVGVGQTIPGTQYTVEGVSGVSVTGYTQPQALIGKVILDTQVSGTPSDLVVVGGPAVNMLAASAIEQLVSEMNSTLGTQLSSEAQAQGGYLYGSQLQPVLQQLGINFGPGTALIFVGGQYPNELVIFGWSGSDTTEATQLFASYLVYGTDASELSNYRIVLLNTQQTVNGYPAVTPVQ